MKFWRNNKLDQEHELQYKEILIDWKNSEECKAWLEGQRLDRMLPLFLTRRYGTYEQQDFDSLFEYIVKNQNQEVLNEA